MKHLLIAPFLFLYLSAWGQTTINGRVIAKGGKPIEGANVYLQGTYDGTSTDAEGHFSFYTRETGIRTLVVSVMGYESYTQTSDVVYMKDLSIKMVEAINQLNGVTLSAGTLEAGDNSKVSVLKPLDIVTTAGAVGDFVGALQTLPGTSTVNEDGRLFVRGGTAGETQVFIDGLRVFQPFNATANNIPTRGRFSPFLFKGITFSTGGYSAEYGQALSSILLLRTTDMPDQEKTDINLMTVGGGVGHTKIWKDQSLSLNAQYLNLAPYEALIPSTQGVKWISPYESVSGEAVYRNKGEKSMFKLYGAVNLADMDLEQENINFDDPVRFRLKNNNRYLNSSYKHFFSKGWSLVGGGSMAWDTNDIVTLDTDITAKENSAHLKLKLKKAFSNRFKLNFGAEYFNTNYKEVVMPPNVPSLEISYNEQLTAGFVESDIYFSNKMALKIGARAEHSALLNAFSLSPRVSLAYKSSEKGQFSLAYGDFYQNPLNEILRFGQEVKSEKTSHYIFNYQYLSNGKTFRAEAYYKDYDHLVKYDTEMPQFNSLFNNSGHGYAAGLDIFWRDNKSIENLDYWVSYSFLDTQRDFGNFPQKARPNFAPAHSLSLVTKYWWDTLKSQVGLTYQFGSGRPYDDPNTPSFMAERTKPFNSLSLNWAYLLDQQKILFFSISNALGFNNINNYQYAQEPNANGVFERRAVRPAADSFFFVGFFWTISTDGKSNQLDNL